MVDETTARKELLELYDGIEKAPHFQDYVKISVALGNGPDSKEIIAGVKALEAAMVFRIVRNYKADEMEVEKLVDGAVKHWNARRATYFGDEQNKPKKDEKLSHVLTATLDEHEREDGFKRWGPKVPIYASATASSSAFVPALKQRRHWKDIGSGPAHGDFTHRIQWYVLSSGGVIRRQKEHPAAVFETLGDYKHGSKYLWDTLCDRDVSMDDKDKPWTDWRVPAYFNDWLTSPECLSICPLLSTFLSFRESRRMRPEDYIRKKLGPQDPKKRPPTFLDFKNGKYQSRE